MTKSETMRDFVIPHVGDPYIFAASGQKCTPAYRQQQMKSKPAYAAKIKAYCPVLSGKQTTCAGCKYEDHPSYDCSGLTMRAAKTVGVSMPHGASSQWNGNYWSEKGPIANVPKDKCCFLFSRSADANPMGHVGYKVNETEAVEARGHAYGVVKTKIKSRTWTDYAVLREKGETDATEQNNTASNMPTLRYGSKDKTLPGPYVSTMQNLLFAKGMTAPGFADKDKGIFGPKTLQMLETFQQANGLEMDGICGPLTWSKLLEDGPEDQPEPEPEIVLCSVTLVNVPEAEADALLKRYPGSTKAVG